MAGETEQNNFAKIIYIFMDEYNIQINANNCFKMRIFLFLLYIRNCPFIEPEPLKNLRVSKRAGYGMNNTADDVKNVLLQFF